MDNQHKKITGYRDLSQEEIDLMNEIKARGADLEVLIEKLQSTTALPAPNMPDYRWINVGKTHLQQGIMALVRAVAQPTTF